MQINKRYIGTMTGACDQKENKVDAYVDFLIEKFKKSISVKARSFTLIHGGFMSGAMDIQQAKDRHNYLTHQF